jgi:Glycosyltransferase family 87
MASPPGKIGRLKPILRLLLVGGATAVVACTLPNVGLWRATGHANTGLFELYGRHVANGGIPYHSGFAFEYPPGAIPPLAVPALLPGAYVPWFHAFEFLCLLAAVSAVALTVRRLLPVPAIATAPVLLGQLALNSFDLWPAALAAVGVWLVLRGNPRTGLAFLGAATAAKLYPVLLVPALLLYIMRSWGRRTAARALLVFTVVVVAVFAPFAALGPGGLAYSLRRARGFDGAYRDLRGHGRANASVGAVPRTVFPGRRAESARLGRVRAEPYTRRPVHRSR